MIQLYRRLLSYLGPYRFAFIGAVLALVVEALLQPLLPLIFQRVLDGGFATSSAVALPTSALSNVAGGVYSTLQAWLAALPVLWLPALVVVLFVIRGVSSFAGDYGMQWVGQRVVFDLRHQVFGRLLALPSGFHDAHATGALTSKLSFDSAQLASSSTQAVTSLVQDTLIIVALLAMMWHISPKLTLYSLVIAPLVGVVISVVSKRLRKATRGVQSAMGEMTQVTQEALAAQRTVKLYAGEAQEVSRFGGAANRVRQFLMKEAAANLASVPVMHIFVSIAIAAVLSLAITQGQRGAMSAGEFMAFLTAMMQLLVPLKRLTSVNGQLQRGAAAAESMFGLLNAAPEPHSGTNRVDRARGELCFEHVGLNYGDKLALDGLTLKVAAGERVALVGASGGGKSSVMNLLPRFYEPTSGKVSLDGVDLKAWDLQNLRAQFAWVSQEPALFDDTVRNNIAYGALQNHSTEAIVAAAKAAHAHDFIVALPQGYDTRLGERGGSLSGGQRQRIAIARALLKDAPIVLLDEATSALDRESEAAVRAGLAVLCKGRTTLVIAHRLQTIADVDRVVVIERGRVVEQGAPKALEARGGAYARLMKAT